MVRRPPLGHVQATAHDMGREYTAITALADTDVPVPATYAHCDDPDVIGAPFYVMERVDGTPYRTRRSSRRSARSGPPTIAGEMVDVLAALHAVDPAAVGLGRVRPAGRLPRATGAPLGPAARRLAQPRPAGRRRAAPPACRARARRRRRPSRSCTATTASTTCSSADDRVRAVLDWEMSTLGDPLTDVALLLVYDRLSGVAGGTAVADASSAPGYPDPDEQLAQVRRGQRTRPGPAGLPPRPAYSSSP